MKQLLLFSLITISSFSIKAQNDVTLNIHHLLNTSDFAFNQLTSHPDFEFEVTRCQYYISDISITHDGGVVTDIEDRWLLVNAGTQADYQLGNFDITSVEAVSFHVGVGPDVNNDDPAQWPADHPLYPQNPSMHWGWASGYRFAAIEGMCGADSPSQAFEIHALGNENYFTTTVAVTASASNGSLIIPIQADYTQALNGLDVNASTIVHGSVGLAITVLENFRDDVFSAGMPLSISESELPQTVSFIPNPSNGQFQVIRGAFNQQTLMVRVTDAQGRAVTEVAMTAGEQQLDLTSLERGTYVFTVTSEGAFVNYQRVVIQ